MAHRNSRRDFLQWTAAAGMGFWVAGGAAAQESKSPNEKVSFACIGCGGKGDSDSTDAGNHGNVVAICDVDDKTLGGKGSQFPQAKKFNDFRKMLEEMDKSIDAVTVSTPDHMHAPAALMALRMGKHCFTQKPLTHTIYEARLLGQVAAEKKLATEMGNQGTAMPGVRKAAALLRKGILGKVSEVHVWTNRPIWPQGGKRPLTKHPPENVKWNLWLGVAPLRPYGLGYHPFSWRGWWDFGTGALGDMACHTVNMPFAGLELRDPVSVQAKTSGHDGDSYPKWSVIDFEFPANSWRAGLKMVWYDGGKLPTKELLGGKNPSESGCIIIGEKGKLFSPNDYGAEFEVMGNVDVPQVEFPQSPGHFEEWVRAIKGGPAAMSNFTDYAGPLTETILLGNLAVWAAAEAGQGPKIAWDAKELKATNAPELVSIVKPTYRAGYTL
jgi:predicted dehydrogenase